MVPRDKKLLGYVVMVVAQVVVEQRVVVSMLINGQKHAGHATTSRTNSYHHYLSDTDVRVTPVSSSGSYLSYPYVCLIPDGPSYVSKTHLFS